jgi:hypothetical protein
MVMQVVAMPFISGICTRDAENCVQAIPPWTEGCFYTYYNYSLFRLSIIFAAITETSLKLVS